MDTAERVTYPFRMTTTLDFKELTRDQRRSLLLGRAVAEHLQRDPAGVLTLGRRNLESLRVLHPRGQVVRWFDEWERLLDGPVEEIVGALTSTSPLSRELRQNTPFAGVLSKEERQQVLDEFQVAEQALKLG